MTIETRAARREDLDAVQALRRQVNDLHVQGRPDFFKPGFAQVLRDRLYDFMDKDDAAVVVAVAGGYVAGFATVNIIDRPETPYRRALRFYHVDEFCVDAAFRRQGVATALVEYMKRDARSRGLDRIELDVWAFNEGALAFYDAAGFRTYRRFMELSLDDHD